MYSMIGCEDVAWMNCSHWGWCVTRRKLKLFIKEDIEYLFSNHFILASIMDDGGYSRLLSWSKEMIEVKRSLRFIQVRIWSLWICISMKESIMFLSWLSTKRILAFNCFENKRRTSLWILFSHKCQPSRGAVSREGDIPRYLSGRHCVEREYIGHLSTLPNSG